MKLEQGKLYLHEQLEPNREYVAIVKAIRVYSGFYIGDAVKEIVNKRNWSTDVLNLENEYVTKEITQEEYPEEFL